MRQGKETAVERVERSTHISLVFEAAVKRVFGGYAVEMTRSEAGARSLLHIRLVTEGWTFSVGWVDPIHGMSELYSLGNTLARSNRRRGRELTLPPMQYNRFLLIAKHVLEDFGMNVTVVAYTSDDALDDSAE